MENYSLLEPNTYVSIGGKQNVTFSYTSPHLQQRIDRLHYLSVSEMEMLNEDKLIKLIIEYVDFWYFGSPAEAPVNYTLVVQGGKNGYACYKEGNGLIFMDPKVAGGYVEGIFYEIARRLIILLTILQPRWQTFSYTKAKECLHWF
jgi:hypothetical protein